MSTKTRRRFTAWVLLSVFLPMLVFSSLHVHERVAWTPGQCVDCTNHLPHAGHLSLNPHVPHDCVLCQFTSLSFVVAVTLTVAAPSVQRAVMAVVRPAAVQGGAVCLLIPRAPPAA